jgi:hypothetical protein
MYLIASPDVTTSSSGASGGGSGSGGGQGSGGCPPFDVSVCDMDCANIFVMIIY